MNLPTVMSAGMQWSRDWHPGLVGSFRPWMGPGLPRPLVRLAEWPLELEKWVVSVPAPISQHVEGLGTNKCAKGSNKRLFSSDCS